MEAKSIPYVLTPMQQGMLYHALSYPESGVDIQQILCTVKEPIDTVCFEKAWAKILKRHAVLRTRFEWEGIETPVQRVKERAEIPIEFYDLQGLDSSNQKKKIRKHIKEDRSSGINMQEAPMIRVTVFYINPSEFTFLWTFHHAILDGRSDRVVLEEFFKLYDAYLEGKPLDLSKPQSYREYAEWMEKRNFDDSESYWRETLKGLDYTTPIPFLNQSEVFPIADETSYFETRIPSDQKSVLESFANENGITLNTMIQGAWALLWHHYTRNEKIVFGATRACRHSSIKGADKMVGLFINTLPLYIGIDRKQILVDFLKSIREQNILLRQHENTPLSSIHKWSSLPPNSPLFETLIVFEKSSLNHWFLSKGDRWLNRQFKRYRKTGYPISLIVFDDEELIIRIEYEGHLFDRKDIKRIISHIQKLLLEMPSYAQHQSVKVPYLSEDEHRTLLSDLNNTYRDYPADLTLVDLFESQVAKTPEAVALELEESKLTYLELNQRSNQLAYYLKRLEVGPEIPVGIFMDRSFEMVIGIYGVIKAGAAYVPLDPEYPLERLSFMLEDSNVPVLLTQSHLLERLPNQKANVICLDTDWEKLQSESTSNPVGGARCENLAYIIYTSGSTGKPKGVMNEHLGIVNRLLWMQEAYQLDEYDRVLQKTPFSFDVSVWEFFWPLQVGARLVMAVPGGHRDNAYLVRLIIEKEITTLHFVPSMLQLFLEEDGIESCYSIKRVICSGEALRYEHKQGFFERLNTELHNLYGPTEAAVDVTYWPCKKDDDLKVVPIGFPVANVQIYILDTDLQPVPAGCVGELYIGGVQVGRGYLNRPNLTIEKFIADPFRNVSGARLYKTGDLARYMPDGSIEYLGRIDFQVKIRGLRVELGEIEARMDEFDGIGQNVVVLSEDSPGDQMLVAYYTELSGSEVDVPELRKYLQTCLPDYMIPQHYMKLDVMPLSPNGKTDRKAMPRPKFERKTDAAYIEPRSREEKMVADVWKKLLHLNKVGVDDLFFDLGGNSLLLIRMLGKLKPLFEKELKIIDFFRYPSIRKLVEYLTDKRTDETGYLKIIKIADKQKEFIRQQNRLAARRRNLNA